MSLSGEGDEEIVLLTGRELDETFDLIEQHFESTEF
jgi:hypothetical protein